MCGSARTSQIPFQDRWPLACKSLPSGPHSHSVFANHRGDKSGRHDELDESAGGLPTTAGPEESLGLDPALERALAALSPRERETVALRFGADLTGPEIAAMTNSTLPSVQQAISRALRRMRSVMDGAAVDDEYADAPHPRAQ